MVTCGRAGLGLEEAVVDDVERHDPERRARDQRLVEAPPGLVELVRLEVVHRLG
jgi:hypothetical protein